MYSGSTVSRSRRENVYSNIKCRNEKCVQNESAILLPSLPVGATRICTAVATQAKKPAATAQLQLRLSSRPADLAGRLVNSGTAVATLDRHWQLDWPYAWRVTCTVIQTD